MNKIAFLDFEASSMSGYPIEIGWALVDRCSGALLGSEAHLIRPVEEWLSDDSLWDWRAEALHGIARSTLLEQGQPADVVAERALEVLGQPDVLVVADSVFDGRWLRNLLDAADMERAFPPRVADVAKAFEGEEVDERKFDVEMRARDRRQRLHRAEADALEWAGAYCASWRAGK